MTSDLLAEGLPLLESSFTSARPFLNLVRHLKTRVPDMGEALSQLCQTFRLCLLFRSPITIPRPSTLATARRVLLHGNHCWTTWNWGVNKSMRECNGCWELRLQLYHPLISYKMISVSAYPSFACSSLSKSIPVIFDGPRVCVFIYIYIYIYIYIWCVCVCVYSFFLSLRQSSSSVLPTNILFYIKKHKQKNKNKNKTIYFFCRPVRLS